MSGNDDENPFGDPAVQSAVTSTTKVDLDDYNPFDNKTTNVEPSPAVMNPSDEPEPPPVSKPQISTAEFQKRQEELERRARELDRREEELRNAPLNIRQNNWPPLPKFCPVQPCFYQDINVDIPVEFQKIVKYLYYLWIGHVSLLLSNLILGILFLFAGGDGAIAMVGLSILYLGLFLPASFLCWFRPAYKAFRDDSSFNFMIFFFVFFFQTMISILNALGIGGMGASGLWSGSQAIEAGGAFNVFVGVLMVVNGICFALAGLADLYMLVRVHKIYRSTGASIAKAQAEFTSGVMKNESFRQAASQAASDAARSQFSGGAGNNQQSNNRY